MTRDDSRIAAAAAALWRARLVRVPIEVLTANWPDLDEAGAYAIARATQALAGETPVGYKLGYTSAAMRAQMGVEHPNYGVLTQGSGIAHDGEVSIGALIHPLVEPEIALLVGREVVEPVADADAMRSHVAGVHPALEIVDTRYEAYRFLACDNIADNSSAARYVIGPVVAPDAVPDLASVEVTLQADGEVLDRGLGAAALDDPLLALAWLANRLIAEGTPLHEGALVLTGGLTRAHAAKPGGRFVGSFSGLGEARVRFI
jgi:2-keto-4-pentenoate hydratase